MPLNSPLRTTLFPGPRLRAEVGEDPGCAGLAPRLEIDPGLPGGGSADGARMWTAARDPDGDPRRLHRPRLELARPQLDQAREAVVEEAGALARLDDLAEALQLAVAAAAQAAAEGQASSAEVVEGG